jgi:secretion/DNA translocation related TadE-like protein
MVVRGIGRDDDGFDRQAGVRMSPAAGTACERGSVSVVVAAAVAMALVVTMGAADVGRALIARARAEAAADFAALAAAQELAFPSGSEPGQLAGDYALRNGARLISCSCTEGSSEAVVSVAVPARGFLLPLADRDVIAISRAVVDLPA